MRTTTHRLFPSAAVLLIGWGALAFGSEYSWAYAPLAVFSVVVGVLGLVASPGQRFPVRTLGLALAGIFVAGALQLVPMAQRAVRTISPASVATDYAQLYATATMQQPDVAGHVQRQRPRPVSIAPSRTVLGLSFLAAFGMLFVGSTRGLNALGPQAIARGILLVSLLVAVLELMQRSSGSDLVYGFWYPPQLKGYQSAPFINRNHTAGWLLMALSLTAGCFAGGVATGFRGLKPGWRHRILWLSSKDASETLLTGAAVVVMAIAIVATASRSGAFCLALVIVMFAWRGTRRQPSASRKAVVSAHLLVVVLAALSLGGLDRLAARFHGSSWSSLDGRLNVWQDTVRIIRDFPLTGTGLNTYGIAMLRYQTVQDGSQYIEAHNDYLQLAAEGGVLLAVPIVLAVGLFVREVWRRFCEGTDDTRTSWLRAGAVIGLVAIAIQAFFDFTLQMPGAAAFFVVLAAIAIHRPAHSCRGDAWPPCPSLDALPQRGSPASSRRGR
jgi:O-antigen ligase